MNFNSTILLLLTCSTIFAQQKGVSPIDPANAVNQQGATYAIVVGISDYQDAGIPDLRFAVKDAEVFADYLRSPAGGSLSEDQMIVLLNEKATQAQFAAALDWLWEVAQENDRAIIYFSGHGDVEKKSLTQPGFLLCWDAPARVYMAGGAFPLSMLQEVISTISVQNKAKVMMVADACRAGKLSGSAVGGAQITGGNLARQYANEIKILSCQPNEFSIEGEQWGGGRGAFSFHLMDGLYGMADSNGDMAVSLMEIGRYLEDNVSTEVAPHNQLPMTVGSRAEKIATVYPELLSKIKEGKKGQMSQFDATASRGIELEVLAMADSTIVEMYHAFELSILEKRFLEPKGNCTDYFYEKLSKEPQLEQLHSNILRNYVAALQDDAQQVMNTMLKSGLTELVLRHAKAADIYKNYPAYLERAAQLLGEDHYMYNTLLARKLFYEGQIVEALKEKRTFYQQALKLQPDLAHAMVEIIRSSENVQLDSAQLYFRQSTELIPSWVEPYIAMGDFYRHRLEQPEKESEMLNFAGEVDPASVLVWYKKGLLASRQEDYETAEKWLLQTIDNIGADICFPCAYNDLGNIYKATNRFDEAEKYYKMAIEEDPDFAIAYDNLGLVFKANKDIDEAMKYFELAISADAGFPNAYHNLGSAYASMRQYDKAADYYQKAIHADSTFIASYNSLGLVYSASRQYEKAEASFKKLLQIDSFYSQAYNNLGILYANMRQYDKAVENYKMSVQVDSLDARAYYNLGNLYKDQRQYEEAEKYLKKTLEIDPGFHKVYNGLGLMLLYNNRVDEAEALFLKLLELDPNDKWGEYNMACSRSLHNKHDSALEWLEKSLDKEIPYRHIMNDSDLDNIKELPRFKELMKKHFPEEDQKKN